MKMSKPLFSFAFFLLLSGMANAENEPATQATVQPGAAPTLTSEGDTPSTAEPTPVETRTAQVEPAAATANEPQAAAVSETPAPEIPAAEPVANEGPSPFELALKVLLSGTLSQADGISPPTLLHKPLLERIYQENHYQPLWQPDSIQALSNAINSLSEDGLEPTEYRFPSIDALLSDPNLLPNSATEAARNDLLLTEAYLRALYNLRYGKVDPERLDADHNYGTQRYGLEVAPKLRQWISAGQIADSLQRFRPVAPQYALLKTALKRYRDIEAAGGWPQIPVSRKGIKPGTSDERIPLVRQRLAASGELASASDSTLYDPPLQEEVSHFQRRHRMEQDGIIGSKVLEAMNVPVQQRIDQIRINLDRQRWFHPEELEEYLAIDVAGFQLRWFKNGEVIWQEHVQVGKPLTKTPIFRDQIEYVILNPTWSVPPTIMKHTILPSLRLDPNYLAKKGYSLLDQRGKPVDPGSVDWQTAGAREYVVRQPPGISNALGRVKFMFPNKFSVFLHDTNHREMFGKTVRTTSSGCIRLRNPFDLAERLLGPQGWDRERIEKTLATHQTTQVNLQRPLPIVIQYQTVYVDGDEISFRSDIYNRDKPLLAAFSEPFQLHLPDLPQTAQTRIRAGVKSASKPPAGMEATPEILEGTPVPDTTITAEAAPTSNYIQRKAPSFLDL